MRIDYLRYMLEIASNESLSKTASKKFISQQGLSRIVRVIEEEQGISIFERDGNKFAVTAAGKEFLKHARVIVDEYDKASLISRMYAGKREQPNGASITLFLSYCIANNLYPTISSAIETAFPSLSISIVEENYDESFRLTQRTPLLESIHFVTLSKLSEIPEKYVFEPVLETTTMTKVGKNSCFADKKSFSKDDLRNLPIVVPKDPVLLEILDGFLGWDGALPRNILLVTTNNNYADRVLKKRNAIGFIDSFFYHYFRPENFVIIPIEGSVKTPSGFLTEKSVELSPEAKRVKEHLKKYLIRSFPLACGGAPP